MNLFIAFSICLQSMNSVLMFKVTIEPSVKWKKPALLRAYL
jgi:hypothetical protein